jgi:hypothetical protein
VNKKLAISAFILVSIIAALYVFRYQKIEVIKDFIVKNAPNWNIEIVESQINVEGLIANKIIITDLTFNEIFRPNSDDILTVKQVTIELDGETPNNIMINGASLFEGDIEFSIERAQIVGLASIDTAPLNLFDINADGMRRVKNIEHIQQAIANANISTLSLAGVLLKVENDLTFTLGEYQFNNINNQRIGQMILTKLSVVTDNLLVDIENSKLQGMRIGELLDILNRIYTTQSSYENFTGDLANAIYGEEITVNDLEILANDISSPIKVGRLAINEFEIEKQQLANFSVSIDSVKLPPEYRQLTVKSLGAELGEQSVSGELRLKSNSKDKTVRSSIRLDSDSELLTEATFNFTNLPWVEYLSNRADKEKVEVILNNAELGELIFLLEDKGKLSAIFKHLKMEAILYNLKKTVATQGNADLVTLVDEVIAFNEAPATFKLSIEASKGIKMKEMRGLIIGESKPSMPDAVVIKINDKSASL